MRRFEFKDDKAYKFWQIELAGKLFTVRWGRIGTKGQEQTKTFASDAAAQKEHDKLVAEKLKKGYLEVTKSKSAPPSPQETLENAIIANPDDLGAHAAYADWLLEQGDPRGEFIQVQLALEDEEKPAGERKRLQAREQELMKAHAKEWLGELAPFVCEEDDEGYSFARSWPDDMRILMLTAEIGRALASAPQVRLLASLTCVDMDPGGLEPLIASPFLTHLRRLVVGSLHDLRSSDFYYSSFNLTQLVGIVELYESLPRLEHLHLEGEVYGVERLFSSPTLNRLRSLQLCFNDGYPLELLAENRAAKSVGYLLFHPQGVGQETSGLTLPGVKALVNSPHLKSLMQLRLHLTTIGDKGCEVIVKSGILERLKVLDLAFGNITDDGAKMLATSPHLKNLELLDLQRNALTDKGLAALRKTGIDVYAEDQHDPDDDSYLYEGEME